MRRIGRTAFWVWGIGMCLVAVVAIGYACATADETTRCTNVRDVDEHGVFVTEQDCPPVP